MKPEIVLMDEPFGALDPGTREDMQVFLLKLWETFKMTVVFVTHDLEEAVYLGTRIIALSQYYADDEETAQGAKIVCDYPLPASALSTDVKTKAEFGELIQQIRKEGFDPEFRQHMSEFNLKHPDSFQTIQTSDAD
jgi:NitT/TauT family transport system ATP-binding protein